jgi:hypothetical protein
MSLCMHLFLATMRSVYTKWIMPFSILYLLQNLQDFCKEIYVIGLAQRTSTRLRLNVFIYFRPLFIICLYIKWFVTFSIFVNIYKTSLSFQTWFKDLNFLRLTLEKDKCVVKRVHFLLISEHTAKISL